ncbi:MAG TPA: hypothetical protein VEY09_05850 [Pyrinomonadaceae bacterium]|nr:hypothetical protein [Pyrinomonadaceae bacterium]
MRKFLLAVMIALVAGGGGAAAAKGQEPKPEVLGIRIGMSVEEARARLGKMGRLEKEERKQQEIWALDSDRSFSYLIVGFDKAYKEVRYVTAKAREGGRAVRYSEVLDIEGAQKIVSPPKYEYVCEVAAKGDSPAYTVIAQGRDPQVLTYFSVKKKE